MRPNILDAIARDARARVEQKKAALPLEELKGLLARHEARASQAGSAGLAVHDGQAGPADLAAHGRQAVPAGLTAHSGQAVPAGLGGGLPFEEALRRQPGVSLILEVKKASPSKGVIDAEFPYIDIARDYAASGAAAISVLTEPTRFLGADGYLCDIAAAVDVPLLRKDFVVDGYMVYEAKALGAGAVLLICALLEETALRECIGIANEIGLSALVEAHSEDEARMALACGARVIGANNRDLRTFEVDLAVSERLRMIVPSDALFVAESGIRTAEDVAWLRSIGADAALIGESVMRSRERREAIAELLASACGGPKPC